VTRLWAVRSSFAVPLVTGTASSLRKAVVGRGAHGLQARQAAAACFVGRSVYFAAAAISAAVKARG
jgi:hypothetical protein